MWRYREWLPLDPDEQAVTLGEGGTPLLDAARLGKSAGFGRLLVKDESVNPTGSFKARGLAAAVTRARPAGATRFVVPGSTGWATAGADL
jgi:threonine synthase